MKRQICGAALAIVVLVFATGCGGEDFGEAVDVSGKILLDGEPLAGASVTFFAEGGLPAEIRTRTATTGADGSFQMTEVYPATYIVSVEQPTDVAAMEDPGMAAATMEASDPLAKYGNESELRAEVTDSTTEFNFELTSR